MDFRSPLDMQDPMAPQFGPPIVPSVTELPPAKMHEVMRGLYGEDDAAAQSVDQDDMLSPPEILSKISKLAFLASQFGDQFLDVCISVVRSVKVGLMAAAPEMPRGMARPLDGALGQDPMALSPSSTAPQILPSPDFTQKVIQ